MLFFYSNTSQTIPPVGLPALYRKLYPWFQRLLIHDSQLKIVSAIGRLIHKDCIIVCVVARQPFPDICMGGECAGVLIIFQTDGQPVGFVAGGHAFVLPPGFKAEFAVVFDDRGVTKAPQYKPVAHFF